MIENLIDKQDSFELVRDQVAAILVLEGTEQQALAVQAAVDPTPWEFRVFTERMNPIDSLGSDTVQTPIACVYFAKEDFELRGSNIMERQSASVTLHIDCWGYGEADGTSAEGHTPGDLAASHAAQRTVRLVRNILMSAHYTYLNLRGLVGRRWVSSISSHLPDVKPAHSGQYCVHRAVFQIELNEYSPQFDLETLELVALDVIQKASGEVVAEADFTYT